LAAKTKAEGRRRVIRRAAQRVFAQKGYHEATISEVAHEAGISEATIYEYFSSKEELLFSIPGEMERKTKETLEFILDHIRGASHKIRAIIYHYLWLYENHLDYGALIMLILKHNRKFCETDAYQVVRERARVLLRVVEEGIASGEFRSDTNPYLVRSMILGTVEHLIIRRLLIGGPSDLWQYVDALTDQIIIGIRNDEAREEWRRAKESPEGNGPSRRDAPRVKPELDTWSEL